MPKRDDIKTILVIGSGPIVIGQARVRLCWDTSMPEFERRRVPGSFSELKSSDNYDGCRNGGQSLH